MKRNKVLLAVLALVLSSVMFMACGAPSSLSKDKYVNIVGTVGSTVIVSDGSKMNLLDSKGKKIGDSAYEIEPIYLSDSFTGFYQAKREVNSGLELMGTDGKFLQGAAPAEKAVYIEAVGVVSEDDNGFEKIDVNAFIAKTNRATDPYVVMAKSGDRANAFYKYMASYGSVIYAEKELNNKMTYYALKTDGTQIASSTEGLQIHSLDKPGDVIVEVTKKETVNEVDKYSYDVYSKTGTKLGTYDDSGTAYGKGYEYSVTSDELVTTKYYIDENGAAVLADVFDYYDYDSERYVKVGTSNDFKIRKINSTSFITAALESASCYPNSSNVKLLTVKEKDATTYKILRPDTGAVLLDNLTTPSIRVFDVAKDKTYTLVVTDGITSIVYSANGTKKTRTLEAGEAYSAHYSGAVRIAKGYDYSLWIPATDKNVALEYSTVESDEGVISFDVAVEGEDFSYVEYTTLSQNMKSWNGSVSSNNLCFDIGVPSSAYRYAAVDTSLIGTARIPMAKSADYTSMEKIDDAYDAGEVTLRMFTAAYAASKADMQAQNIKYVSAMLYTDSKGNTQIYKLGEDCFVELIDSIDIAEGDSSSRDDYDEYFYKVNANTGERTIHKFVLNNNVVEIKDIASDLSEPELVQAPNGNAYVMSTVGDKNALYDLDKNLLLPANYVIEEVCVNGYVIVSTGATGLGYTNAFGLVKLEKNGKHKLVKQIEYSRISVSLNGMMTLMKNYFDTFVEICDKDGKTIEPKVYGIRELDFRPGAANDEAMKAIAAGGERKVTSYGAIALADGKEKLLTLTVSEDDLSFSIMNLLV